MLWGRVEGKMVRKGVREGWMDWIDFTSDYGGIFNDSVLHGENIAFARTVCTRPCLRVQCSESNLVNLCWFSRKDVLFV